MASLVDMLTGGDEFDLEREEAEYPKAHDKIDSILEWDDAKMGMSQEDLMNIVMGIGGAPGSLKGLTSLIQKMGGKQTFPQLIKDLVLAVKGTIKGGKMVADPGFKYGAIGKPKPETISTVNPNQVKDFINKMYGRDKIKPNITKYADKGYKEYHKQLENKLSLTGKGTKKIHKKEADENTRAFTAAAGSLFAFLFGTTLNQEEGLDNKIASLLRPDPEIGTKEQHDEDMDMLVKLMSPETNLKYLKNTGQGYPSDPEMYYDSEEWQNKDTNEILLQLLREQSNKSDAPDEEDEGFSYPSKGYGALY